MSIESRKHQYGKVFDHWQIKEYLGGGSNGKSAVFRLEHTESPGVESALKVVSLIEERGKIANFSQERQTDYFQTKRQCSERAEQEVLLMNELQGNTNIVDYLDHTFVDWSDEIGFGRDMLIRMEKLTDLRSQIANGKLFSREEILKIGRDICTALILCHKHGILHRDIKPENIFINKNGSYKLGDFGISRMIGTSASAIANTGIGTPQYWAPEQTSGKYDVRVDIYSLGLVLYELANKNRLPFSQSTYIRDEDVHRRLLGATLPAPCAADNALSQVILKACAFQPEDRHQTSQEFLHALNLIDTAPSYRTIPAQENVLNTSYSTMPAQSGAPGPAFDTVPLQENAANPSYITVPAQHDPPTSSFATVPAQNNAQSAKPVHSASISNDHRSAQDTGKSGKQKQSNMKTILILLGAVCLACVAVFVCILFFLNRDPQDTQLASSPAESGTASTSAATQPLTTVPAPTEQPDPFARYEIGDIIRFGKYEQDSNLHNGPEAISWIVLDKQDGKMMLISEYGLSMQRFQNSRTPANWYNSDIRTWLNEAFFYSAFEGEERERILTTTVTAEHHPDFPADPGMDTQDKVFLLSYSELMYYFPDQYSRVCPPTVYAKSQNAYERNGGCWYWLRTRGNAEGTILSINSDGTLDLDAGVYSSNGCARPVIWIEIHS